jgi:general stress protein YciG
MATQDRGFASMDPEKQRAIASKGGRTAHQKGTAHEWTPAEAREAGRKGGIASHRRPPPDSATAPETEAAPDAPAPADRVIDVFSYDW